MKISRASRRFCIVIWEGGDDIETIYNKLSGEGFRPSDCTLLDGLDEEKRYKIFLRKVALNVQLKSIQTQRGKLPVKLISTHGTKTDYNEL